MFVGFCKKKKKKKKMIRNRFVWGTTGEAMGHLKKCSGLLNFHNTSPPDKILDFSSHNYLNFVSLGYGLDDRGFESRQELEILLFTTVSRPALGSIQPPIQWIPGALSLGLKRPGREADHSLPSSAEVKNSWSYASTPQYAFMAWCSVKKSTGKTTFNLFFISVNWDTIMMEKSC
jgi:hypothetical protein